LADLRFERGRDRGGAARVGNFRFQISDFKAGDAGGGTNQKAESRKQTSGRWKVDGGRGREFQISDFRFQKGSGGEMEDGR
jgi:hypothetical protein